MVNTFLQHHRLVRRARGRDQNPPCLIAAHYIAHVSQARLVYDSLMIDFFPRRMRSDKNSQKGLY